MVNLLHDDVNKKGTIEVKGETSKQVAAGTVVQDTVTSLKERQNVLRKEVESIDVKLHDEILAKFREWSLEDEFDSQNERLKKEVVYPFLKRILKEKLALDPILIKDREDKNDVDVNNWYRIGDPDWNESRIWAFSKIKDKKLLLHLLPDILEATSDYPEYKDRREHMDKLAEKCWFKEMWIKSQTENYGFIEYRYELWEFKEERGLTIKTDSWYKTNVLRIDRDTSNFYTSTCSSYPSTFAKLFRSTEEPYLTWKEEFFQENMTIRQKFDEIDKSIRDISTKQNDLVNDFKKEISPLEATKKEKQGEIKSIYWQIKNLEQKAREQQARHRISEEEKDLQIRNQKALLEWKPDTRYMLYPTPEITHFSQIVQDLYWEEIRLAKKQYKPWWEYHKIEFDESFENKELGISIGLYSREFYVDGPENTTNHYNGIFIKRSDGTYSRWPERRWRNGSWDVNEKFHIRSVKNIKVVDNRIIIEIQLWDGSKQDIDIGVFTLPPVYTVYRNNKTYRSFWLQEILSKMNGQNKIVDSQEGIFEEWIDIVENDFIKDIPDNAVVITDNAALKGLPSLANKKIVNIEKDILSEVMTSSWLVQLPYYAKAINPNPSNIQIFLPSCADHAEISDYDYKNTEYVKIIQEQLQEIFPNSKIVITDNPDDLNNNTNTSCIKVVDRHRSWEGSWRIRQDSQTLLLPLYENEPKSEFGEDTKINSYVKNRFAEKFKQRNS